MPPKLSVVSGKKLTQFLQNIGYEIIRQRGSHIRLRKMTITGEHNITVSLHKEIAKGTLNDILNRVSLWNNIPKDELLDRLR